MPNTFVTAAKVEFTKLISRKKNRVLIVLIIIASFTASVFSSGGMAVQIAGMNFNFYNGAFLILSVLNSIVLPMIVFTMSADIIAHEFSDQTIKAGLLRPINKTTLFLSKWTAIVLFGVCCLGVSFVFGGLISVILRQIDFFSALISYIVSILPMCAFAAMSALISTAISSPAMSMFISIVVYLLLNGTGLISSFLGVIFFTAHINWYKMFLGSISTLPLTNIINIAVMMTAYTALFLIVGSIAFSNKKV